MRQGFKIWTESTATSPSGRHLGRYKTLVQDDDMADFFITQIELPLQFGFAPTRWTQALQTLLPKDPGMPKLERLRVIELFEADYNFVLRIVLGRRSVWIAQKYEIYMPAQRAQPGNLCIAAALNKLLSYDLMRQIKKLAASFDNNAKGCYDKIVPPPKP